MVQIEGFGRWKFLNKDFGEYGSFIGIINLQKGYFFETDEIGENYTGKTFVLNSFGGWEIDNHKDKNKEEWED